MKKFISLITVIGLLLCGLCSCSTGEYTIETVIVEKYITAPPETVIVEKYITTPPETIIEEKYIVPEATEAETTTIDNLAEPKYAILACNDTLPKIVSKYTPSGRLESQVVITDVQYVVDSTNAMQIRVIGEKVYGDGNDYGWIVYKVYEPDGFIARAETILTDLLSVGDKFREDIYLHHIVSGIYVISFYDYDYE